MNCKYPVALRKRRAPSESSEELENLRNRLNDVEALLANLQKDMTVEEEPPMEELSKYLDHAALSSMLKPLRESLESFEQSISYVYEEYDDPTSLLLPRIMENEDKETDFIAYLIAYFFQLGDHPYVSSVETYELVRQMHTLNQDGLLLLMILATASRSLPSNHPILVETGLTADEISERFMESYNKQRVHFVKDSLATVQAYILAAIHHMSFEKVEAAWKAIASGVGAAWSVNLHVMNPSRPSVPQIRRCQIWAALCMTETTVAGTTGRPNLITITGLQSEVPSIKISMDISLLCRQINIRTTSGTLMDYQTVLVFDAAIDNEIAKVEPTIANRPQNEGDVIELYAVQAKLHQPHITTHPQSEKKLTYAITKLLYHLGSLSSALGKDLNKRLTLVQCRFMQALIIMYTYLHAGGSLLDLPSVKHSLASLMAGGVWRKNVQGMASMILNDNAKRVELNLDPDSFPGMLYASTDANFLPANFFDDIEP